MQSIAPWLLAVQIAVGTASASFPGAGYELIEKSHEVSVFRRASGSLIDIAAEGVIAAPPEKVRAVLLDYPHHASFLPHMAEVRVLSQQPDALLVYQRLKLPVIADRDMVLRITWGQQDSTLWTHFASVSPPGGGPPPPHGVVRVTNHDGGWQLTPIDNGRATFARYRMRMDLSGSLPGWMARSRAGRDVPALFDIIRKRAQ
jgi:hypothetical protein